MSIYLNDDPYCAYSETFPSCYERALIAEALKAFIATTGGG